MTVELPDAYVKVRYPRSPEDVTHLSHSSISTYLRCPRQWAFSYLEGLRRPPGVALIKGSAVDAGLTHNLRQKVTSRVDLPITDVKDATEDAYRADVNRNGGQSEIQWDGSSFPKGLDSAINLTSIHMLHHSPQIQPTEVQLELHRTLPDGRDFVGHLDFVTAPTVIGDFKTGKRRMGQESGDSDKQADAYGFLVGKPVDFVFWRAIDSGTRLSTEIVETKRTAAQISWFERQATLVSAAIDTGVYPPNTGSWACSPKWCGYWTRCQVEHREPEIG